MPRPCGHAKEAPDENCGVCKLALRSPQHANRWDAEIVVEAAKPQPSLFRKAVNFGKALVNHLAAGRPQTTDLEATARQSICESCTGPGGFYIAETDTCVHPSCGCKIRRKSRWKDQKCPLGKW
jgi:hypothetical protein